jgi:RNA polymerase sigma-70 factor (ECF subfamily)
MRVTTAVYSRKRGFGSIEAHEFFPSRAGLAGRMELSAAETCSPFVDALRPMPQFSTAAARNVAPRRARVALDEIDLIHRVAARDCNAFDALYRGYYPRLKRFIERVTRRPQLVDEIVDDTMLVVWRRARSYNLRSALSTWIFGIALRCALKALKTLDAPVDFDADRCPEQSTAGPEGLLQQRETRVFIERALGGLSSEHRAALELCYFEGRSCAEIAAIMQCPVGTVKTRMFYARRQLRIAMGAVGPVTSRPSTTARPAAAATHAGTP